MNPISLDLTTWDRTFLDLSSKLTHPFCESWRFFRYRMAAPLDPQKFENCSTRVREIAFRSLIGASAVAAAVMAILKPVRVLGTIAILGAMGKMLRALGFALQNNQFTHVLGRAPEKTIENSRIKLTTWNICGLAGGFSLDHGGVVDWHIRFDGIADTIRQENPDVLVLQEVVDTALAEALIKEFSGEYAHFYIHMGPNVWGVGSGIMVFSKCAVHDFSYTQFSTNTWELNRGFATLELKNSSESSAPSLRIVGTHLSHGDSEQIQGNKIEQIAQIVDSVAQKTLKLPTIVAGDFNIERDLPSGEFLKTYFEHGYLGSEFTCTNRLIAEWDSKAKDLPEEMIDYISLLKENKGFARFENVARISAQEGNTRTARSDHDAISAEIVYCKAP